MPVISLIDSIRPKKSIYDYVSNIKIKIKILYSVLIDLNRLREIFAYAVFTSTLKNRRK
jgi:hypothetical protein